MKLPIRLQAFGAQPYQIQAAMGATGERAIYALRQTARTMSRTAWEDATGLDAYVRDGVAAVDEAHAARAASGIARKWGAKLEKARLVEDTEADAGEAAGEGMTGYVEGVATTEALHAWNDEVRLQNGRAADLGYTMAEIWCADLDDRTCEECADMDGTVSYDGMADYPPLHVNCLLPDSLVTPCGQVTGTSDRWYDGDIVVIRTASGNRLSCTPNHPILTRSGWVSAGKLNKGDEVVSASEWRLSGDVHDKNVPSSIQDVAEAFGRASEMLAREVPVAAEDFHGDGVGSKVAVVRADGFLSDGLNAAGAKSVSDLLFCLAGMGATDLSGLGACLQFLARAFATTRSIVRRLYLGCSRFSRHSRPLDGLGLALGASLNPRFAKLRNDGTTRNAEQLGQGQLAGAGQVFADKTVDIQTYDFHGRVLNLQTEYGYYVAGGIITHNCRCYIDSYVADGSAAEAS